jgi:hypothetical protein
LYFHGLVDLTKAVEINREFIGLVKQNNKDFETIRNDERFKKLVYVSPL